MHMLKECSDWAISHWVLAEPLPKQRWLVTTKMKTKDVFIDHDEQTQQPKADH